MKTNDKNSKKRAAPPRYDEAFRAGAVRMVTEQGRPSKEVAQELGICIDTLRSWLKAAGVQMGQADRQNRNARRERELEAEVRALRKKLAEKDEVIELLKKSIFHCSRGRVHRLMKAAGIHSQRKRAYKATTNSRHNCPIAPNLLQRQFTFSRPNQAWVGDITYIPTGEGWLYFAIVKDLCTRKIVGYAFSQRIDTQLTLDALNMAVRRERPAPGLIFHSDRGVQYAAAAFRERLASLGVRQSMSRKGDPYDNAVAENFFSCLKCELVHLRRFDSRRAAQANLFTYIEAFYNTIRPHSSLGWLPPRDFVKRLLDWEAA